MTEQTTESFELSPQQETLWLAEPAGPPARVQAVVDAGALTAAQLESALSRSVERHEILRTTFRHQPGIKVPLQAVADSLAPVFRSEDLSGVPASEQPERVQELCEAELAEAVDFANGPLVRGLHVGLGDRALLVLTLSGLCADPGSVALLVQELAINALGGGELIEDPLQYADFAAWQNELQGGEDEEAQTARAFWSEASEAAAVVLPFVQPEAAPAAPRRVPVAIAPELPASLAQLAARYGASMVDVVHAAWHTVLGRSAGEAEVTLGLVSDRRRHDDLEGAAGAFARPVPVTSALGAEITFAELLGQISHAAEQATVWQDYAPPAAAPLHVGFLPAEQPGSAGLQLERVSLSGTPLRLALTCIAGEGSLRVAIEHDPAYLATASAERLAGRLATVLSTVATDAGRPVARLELLGEDERELLVRDFGTGEPVRDAEPAHARFAAHAAAAPDRVAVTDERGTITYGELDRRANQLAHRLRALGAGPDATVGLCTDRSIDMAVGLLGILKAGAAYVPLHLEHPAARLRHQLETAQAVAVVTQEALATSLGFEGQVVCLDRDRAALEAEDAGAPDTGVSAEHLAYVIYTSGSTGTPKGVGVTHGNLAAYAAALLRRLETGGEPLSFGMVTSVSTDLGNTSLYGALCSGGTLVLVSPTAAADAGAFAALARRTPIDVLKITPSHIGALIAGGEAGVLPRRRLILGGERAPWDLIDRVRGLQPELAILNHYGPTEATIGATTFEVGEGPGVYAPATVPIGSPLDGDTAYVLDEHGALVPLGAPGRLHLGGAGVARGYIGAPELTAERFVEDPFNGGRMYDTGDVVRWLPDGALEFLGRVDEQVKIRGYRVEPAEVEAALRNHAVVREAVVLARASAAGDVRLVAYCVVESSLGQTALSSHLADWLPEYMIPSAFVELDSLPMTPSGKIDRLALPDPEESDTEDYLAPRTPVEQTLAEIWVRVLGVERIGVHDDFFALGGHSLLATQVVAQVRSDFAVELPLHSLFSYPSIATLAEQIVVMMGDSEEEETAQLLAELEGLSDEEAERLLAEVQQPEA